MSKSKIYITHDNGGRPFRCSVKGDTVEIFRWVGESEGKGKRDLYEPLLTQKFIRIFPGKKPVFEYSDRYSFKAGNTLLLQLTESRYMYVGEVIYTFETDKGERILEYFSPIGNSDVPYPYAVGEFNTYLVLEKLRIANSALDFSKDIYAQAYGHIGEKVPSKKMRVKMIQKRLW